MHAATSMPALLSARSRQSEVSSIKQVLDVAREEAVTGLSADKSAAVRGQTGKIHRLEQSISYSQDRQRVLDFTGSRMDATQVVLQSVRDNLQAASDDFAAPQLEDHRYALTIASQGARNGLGAAVSAFNSESAGRMLFGGNIGDVSPLGGAEALLAEVRTAIAAAPAGGAVAALDAYFDDPAGGYATSFYQGGTSDGPSVEVSPGNRITPDIRGDSAAVRESLKVLAMGALTTDAALSQTARDELTEGAFSKMKQAEQSVLNAQTAVGVNQNTVEDGRVRYQADEAVSSAALQALIGVDQFEAASRMSSLTNQLEAAYATTARMASLSLTNYLR